MRLIKTGIIEKILRVLVSLIKIMKKKNLILVLTVVILLLIVAGVFLWPHYEQIKIEKDLEKLVDYAVRNTPEGKVIESKDGRIEIIVPEKWRIRGEKNNMVGPIYVLDIEASEVYQEEKQANISKLIKDLLELKTGCLFIIGYIEKEESLEDIERKAKEFSQDIKLLSESAFSLREIGRYEGLQHVLDTVNNGYWIDFSVPTEGKTYVFSIVFHRNNINKCSQEFDKFLETVSIE